MTEYMTSPFNVRGLSTQAVRDVLGSEPIRPWTVKQICTELGLTHEERDLKAVSNRCGYLRSDGTAKRIAQGTYVLNEKGNPMSDQYQDTGSYTPTPAAAMPTVPVHAAALSDNPLACPECKFVGRSEMGLKAHITRSHKKAKGLPPDEVFQRVAEATMILFPDPAAIYDRFEEIGELRKSMIRALNR